MSILRCSQCKGAVLSVASRCPHCGLTLPYAHDAMTAAARRPEDARVHGSVLPLVATFLVGGLIIAGAVMPSPTGEPMPQTPVTVAPAAATPPIAQDTALVPAAAAVPVIAVASAATSRRRPMVASQWVNLRRAPSRSAKVLLVVPPQALVHADSSAPGWRRVAYDGTVGWVAEQHLVPQNPR
jgi:hypothetical protein